jgi:probable F420-dependent oxidoreductase
MSPHDRPFRFGVEMSAPFEGRSWADSARELEDLGYSTLFVPDHVHSPYGPIAAMATALAATSHLCVAPLVMAVDFRNPVFLAKEIATLDVMFPGRVELGVGAGYNPLDYSRSGIPMDPPGRRVSRLMEYVQVLRLLFLGEECSFSSVEFQLEAVTGVPTPATPGGPRILVAGGGPRLLGFAGEAADIVGVNPSTAAGRDSIETFRDAMPSAIDAKVALVREAAGVRWDDLELNAWISTARLTDDPAGLLGGLAARADTSLDDVLASPVILVGTESDVADRLRARRERWGYSYTCLPQAAARSFAPVVHTLRAT